MITLAEENYLKAILTISLRDKCKVSTNSISDETGTSAASVSDMIKKLQEKKLIKHEKYKGVKLTKKGNVFAASIIRKHRLWETFLVNNLNFDWSEVHDLAEQLEHIKSEKLIDKLDEFLNYPKFDPHGEAIPNKNGEITSRETIPLNSLSKGNKGKIMGVTLDEKLFLDYLTKLNIGIGSEIFVIEKIKFDNSISLKINKKTHHISNEVAKHLLIKLFK